MAREKLQAKRARYARELKNRKKDNGKELTPVQAGFRMGVLKEAKQQADIYKYKKAHGTLPEQKVAAEYEAKLAAKNSRKKNNG